MTETIVQYRRMKHSLRHCLKQGIWHHVLLHDVFWGEVAQKTENT